MGLYQTFYHSFLRRALSILKELCDNLQRFPEGALEYLLRITPKSNIPSLIFFVINGKKEGWCFRISLLSLPSPSLLKPQKSTVLRFLLIISVWSLGLCLNAQTETGEVRYVSSPQKGILVLDASGHGKKKTVAFDDATEKAFKVILKNGIPGSSQYLPLLGGNAFQVYQDKAAFFEQFFAEKTYLQFLVEQRRGDFKRRARKTDPNVRVRLAVNVTALRRYLEEAGVLRKFGF